ncbi:MAG: hypothetical protein O2816_06035 [Planctomycetota bacterium]|nr:hypothetical protein [Planctomycetota bacterium]
MNHRYDDEHLLEWVLNPEGQDENTRQELTRDPGAARRAEELGAFLVHCRDLGRDLGQESAEAAPASALAQRVLARTTREDLSWRGDLALVGTHLRRRVADSGWMKLAAASLILHLMALPALAIYVLVAEPKQPYIEFIPVDDYYPEGFPESVDDPAPDLEAPEGKDPVKPSQDEGR